MKGVAVLGLEGGRPREGAGLGGEGDPVLEVQIDGTGGVLALEDGLGLEGDAGEHVAIGHARVCGLLCKDQLRRHHIASQRRSCGEPNGAGLESEGGGIGTAGGGEVGKGGAAIAPARPAPSFLSD